MFAFLIDRLLIKKRTYKFNIQAFHFDGSSRNEELKKNNIDYR